MSKITKLLLWIGKMHLWNIYSSNTEPNWAKKVTFFLLKCFWKLFVLQFYEKKFQFYNVSIHKGHERTMNIEPNCEMWKQETSSCWFLASKLFLYLLCRAIVALLCSIVSSKIAQLWNLNLIKYNTLHISLIYYQITLRLKAP